ncbi:MAG: dynamin family protein [Burkholderiaceae bacterium]
MGVLDKTIAELGGWQGDLGQAVSNFREWLSESDLADATMLERMDRIQQRLGRSAVSIAFVAEFSRGKSELINALFFADQGQRIVPSSAGRTTMCPTELLWDPALGPGIRLLPMDSRRDDRPISELREDLSTWELREFTAGNAGELKAAFDSVKEVDKVTVERASELGFFVDTENPADGVEVNADGSVDVPRWRYALVNIPHPLLKSGLTIIDTPGLNAIGNEPELTINTIPNADAVLFVLAADAGVTRSDIDVWNEHISASHGTGRLAVLNKIDGLWDELKTPAQIDDEINGQVTRVAETLRIDQDRVFPVSAQKGLVARIQNDDPLLARSGLLALEKTLSDDLVPQQRRIVSEHVDREFESVAAQVTSLLKAQRRNAAEQAFELSSLRGKNRDKMGHMATRIRMEREEFDKSLRQLQGLRSVFARHSSALTATMGTDRLKRHVRESRDMMRASKLSIGLHEGMNHLFLRIGDDLNEADEVIREISTMMGAMYRSFSAEHGLNLGSPVLFSMDRFRREIERLDSVRRNQFGPATMMTTERWALMRRFYETIAVRIKDVYRSATKEIQAWLRSVMAPIEGQVREHQGQLKRRLDSVKRVLEANESLDDKIAEIEANKESAEYKLAACDAAVASVRSILGQPDTTAELEAA